MGRPIEGLNPVVLRWARKVAGYSLEEAGSALSKDAEVVSAWERGESAFNLGQAQVRFALSSSDSGVVMSKSVPFEKDWLTGEPIYLEIK